MSFIVFILLYITTLSKHTKKSSTKLPTTKWERRREGGGKTFKVVQSGWTSSSAKSDVSEWRNSVVKLNRETHRTERAMADEPRKNEQLHKMTRIWHRFASLGILAVSVQDRMFRGRAFQIASYIHRITIVEEKATWHGERRLTASLEVLLLLRQESVGWSSQVLWNGWWIIMISGNVLVRHRFRGFTEDS